MHEHPGVLKDLQSEPTSTWAHDLAVTEQGKYPCLIQGKLRHTEVTFKMEAQVRLTLKKLITPAPIRNVPGPSSAMLRATFEANSPCCPALAWLTLVPQPTLQGPSPAPMTSGAG